MVCQWHRNPEISLSSRNNPEMSQRSLDVPIVVKFSIYIFPWDLLWTGWYHLNYFEGKSLTFHTFSLKSETFKKSQMSEPFDVPSGCSMNVFCVWMELLESCSNDIVSLKTIKSHICIHSRPSFSVMFKHDMNFFCILMGFFVELLR